MKLLKFYEKSNAAMGISTDEEQLLHTTIIPGNSISDANKMFVNLKQGDAVNRLPVIMPTAAVLKMQEDNSLVKFNPMAESIMAVSQSEVQKRITVAASGRIVVTINALFKALLEVALNSENHDNLPPALFNIVRKLPVVKKGGTRKKIIAYANAVLGQTTGFRGKRAIGRFKHVKNVTVAEDGFARATMFVPVFKDILEEDVPYGITIPNKAAVEIVKGIVAAIFDGMGTMVGTNERVAPYYKTTLAVFAEVAKHLNELSVLTGLSKTDGFLIDLSWVKEIDNLEAKYLDELNFRFPGNIGPLSSDGEVSEDDPVTPAVKVERTKPTPVAAAVEETKAPWNDKAETLTNETLETKPMKLIDLAALAANGSEIQFNKPVELKSKLAVANNPNNAGPKVERIAKPAVQKQQASSGAVKVERINRAPVERQANMVHLFDVFGQGLTCGDGRPFMVPNDGVPEFGVMQKQAANGRPIFNSDGTPALIEADLNTPQQPNLGNNRSYPQSQSNNPAQAYFANKQRQQQQQNNGYPANNGFNPMANNAPQPQMNNPYYQQPAPQPQMNNPYYQQPAPQPQMNNTAMYYQQQQQRQQALNNNNAYYQPQQPANTVNMPSSVNWHRG